MKVSCKILWELLLDAGLGCINVKVLKEEMEWLRERRLTLPYVVPLQNI